MKTMDVEIGNEAFRDNDMTMYHADGGYNTQKAGPPRQAATGSTEGET